MAIFFFILAMFIVSAAAFFFSQFNSLHSTELLCCVCQLMTPGLGLGHFHYITTFQTDFLIAFLLFFRDQGYDETPSMDFTCNCQIV